MFKQGVGDGNWYAAGYGGANFTMSVADTALIAAGGYGIAAKVTSAGTRTATVATSATTSAESKITRVFRVESPDNARVIIDADGNVTIRGTSTLFLNFGDEVRAQQFLAQRLSQGFEGTTIKSFDVPTAYLENLEARAVPESMARGASVFAVDVTKTSASYGLRPSEFAGLTCAIIPGSAC
jgi:hypothetical protein